MNADQERSRREASKLVQFDNSSAAINEKEKKEQKKLERALKKIAREQKQLRDHLTREKTFNEASNRRGWKDWESWCEQVTFDELKDELKAVTQSVNHLLDRTNHAVETIQTHREHAGEQYLRNFQNHSELIDYMMELFKIFHASADQMYEVERERLVRDFYDEACYRDGVHHNRKTYYGNLAHATVSLLKYRLQSNEENFIERKVEVEAASFVQRDDYADKAMKRETFACYEIRSLVNLFNNTLWPRERFDQYQKTLSKSLEADKQIDEMGAKMKESLKLIAKLEEKLQELSHEQLVKVAKLKSEQQFMSKLMHQAKEICDNEVKSDTGRLTQLVAVCETTKKSIKRQLEKGKALETAVKICAKYEKPSDKIERCESSGRSFRSSNESSNGTILDESSGDDIKSSDNEFKKFNDDFKSFNDLISSSTPDEEFFKKLSKVEAECLLMRSYKSEMIAKNEALKAMIKEKTHECQVEQNLMMLRLDTTPSIGKIGQISHHIPQIKTPIDLQKRFKLCKYCRKDFMS